MMYKQFNMEEMKHIVYSQTPDQFQQIIKQNEQELESMPQDTDQDKAAYQ